MVNIYSNYNSTLQIPSNRDFSTDSNSAVSKKYVTETSNPTRFTAVDSNPKTGFAAAIYGNGPYSLLCPNAKSDILAQNIDLIA